MVNLLVGRKGSGKTKSIVDNANARVEKAEGSVVFINKSHRLMYDLDYKIRVVCMDDYEYITNSDEYIGFLYGIISSDHDIEAVYIDSILKHTEIEIKDIVPFLERLENLSKKYNIEFFVSISADKEEFGDKLNKFSILL